jgi:two-component system sensor histidine kinase DesK
MDQRLPALELPPAVDAAFALAVREGITNVIRHAEAQRVEIEVEARGEPGSGEWVLSIQDDGRGGAEARSGHIGLEGFRERAEALGGRFELDSPPGGGTRLKLTASRNLPQQAPAARA